MDGGGGGRVQQEQDRYKSITSHHYNVLGGLRGPSKRGAAPPLPPPPAAEEAEDGGGFGCEPPLATLRLPLLAWRYSGMAAVGFLGSIVRLGLGEAEQSRAEQSKAKAKQFARQSRGAGRSCGGKMSSLVEEKEAKR